MAPASSESKPVYAKDEKALCFHGELLYEAKVTESRRSDPKDKSSPFEYRVHYKGWKNTWDDWVPQDRLRKLTDDNRELANNLRREVLAQTASKAPPKTSSKSRRGQGSEFGSGRGSEERSSAPITGGRGSKRARDNDIEKVGDSPFLTPGNSPLRDLDMSPPFPSFNPVLAYSGEPGPGSGPGADFSSLNHPFPCSQFPQAAFTPENTPTSGLPSLDRSPSVNPLLYNPVAVHRYCFLLDGCDDDDESPALRGGSTVIKPTKSRTSTNPNPRPITGGKHNVFLYNELEDLVDFDADLEDMAASINVRRDLVQQEQPVTSKKPQPQLPTSSKPASSVATSPAMSEMSSDHEDFTPKSRPTGPSPGTRNKPIKHVPYLFPNKRPRRNVSDQVSQSQPEMRDVTDLDQSPDTSPDREAVDKSSKKARSYHTPLPGTGSPSKPQTIVGHKRAHPRASPAQRFARVIVVGDPAAQPLIHSSRRCTTCIALGEDNYYNRPSIRISIPDHLKSLLVDDWENVTKSLLLVPLPSKAPANYILDEYFNEEKMNRRLGSVEADILLEFVAGLKTYFEKAIGKILLYRFERAQLAEVRKLWESGQHKDWEGRGPGDCYGAEHLTRMVVNLPEIIAQTNMDAASVNRLKTELSKFSTWLAQNSSRFFCAKYEKPSAEYVESAR
ncbi:hypothetical protein B0A52_00177 [Exophiala mesophila]|uniref:Chromatin modification-related protein EAF3 n=1 Tax=Exophiala mesophila TaxID=212818 RepID=A0A438NJB4_EXOME|nr:hypothetical protein B0A52_00177 [Exophiala mesophila]